jgi:hypothetical protein
VGTRGTILLAFEDTALLEIITSEGPLVMITLPYGALALV